jgi:hypothetical protein
MSVRDAVWPSFVTFVESLTLSASVSSFFDLSNFWTLPVTSLFDALDDDAVEPVPIEPLELLPVEPVPIEPELPVLGVLLELPVLSRPVLVLPVPFWSGDVLEPVLPVAPEDDDPLDPLVPLDPVCAQAGAATSSPAAARLATLPHSIFITYPLNLLRLETTRHPAMARRVGFPNGSDAARVRQGRLSDRLAT